MSSWAQKDISKWVCSGILHPLVTATWNYFNSYLLSQQVNYKGCSESNASCFMMLAHDMRGGYRWYGSRGWTFPPVFLYILLLCDRWQQRGSLTKWYLTWSMYETKGKKCTPLHSLMLAEALWSPNSVCEHSELVDGVFQKQCHHSHCETVALLHWYRFLQPWHAEFLLIIGKNA